MIVPLGCRVARCAQFGFRFDTTIDEELREAAVLALDPLLLC